MGWIRKRPRLYGNMLVLAKNAPRTPKVRGEEVKWGEEILERGKQQKQP
jgi:hypothetical protein